MKKMLFIFLILLVFLGSCIVDESYSEESDFENEDRAENAQDDDISEKKDDTVESPDDNNQEEHKPSECLPGVETIKVCEEDSSKIQLNICDEEGFWQKDGSCYVPQCSSGETSLTECETDPGQLQKQKCNERRLWENDGVCYSPECEEGESRKTACLTDANLVQDQICSEEKLWINDGDCQEPVCAGPNDYRFAECPEDAKKVIKQVCHGKEKWEREWQSHWDCFYRDCPDEEERFCHEHKGLKWTGLNDIKELNRADAISYCEELGGVLPDIGQLRSFIINCDKTEYPRPESIEESDWCRFSEECKENNCWTKICRSCKADAKGIYSLFGHPGMYWSSTQVSSANYYVDFIAGDVEATTTGLQEMHVLCVKPAP